MYFQTMRYIALALITAALTAAAADTASVRAAGDSLRAERAAVYGNAATPFDPASSSQSDLFRSDGASAPEMLRYRALTSAAVPFSLSSGLNRLLRYGDPARPQADYPTASITAQAPFLPYSPRFFGAGLLSGAQTESFAADPQNGLSYAPYPVAAVFPELYIFWENGVFNQNTLNLRLSRPLSPNLTLGAGSQYRFLNGQRFNHERNDIMNVYETFYADTSYIMNRGYNPHVDERSMDAALLRTNADSSKLYAAFSYADLQNEYALDLPAESLDKLRWASLYRTMRRFDVSLTDKELRPLRVNAKAALANEELRSFYRGADSIANGGGEALSFIVDADASLPSGTGLAVKSMVKRMETFNDSEYVFSEHRAEAFYRREFRLPRATAAVDASAGAALFLGFDTLYVPVYGGDGRLTGAKAEATASHTAPTGRAAVSLSTDTVSPGPRARVSLFAELSPYAVRPDYAAPRYSVPFGVPPDGVWAKSSIAAGAEAAAQTRFAGILVGYRNQTNDDPLLLRSLWPEGCPPYRQPRNTVIVAPWTERVGGFAMLSRVIITDTKPFVKASASLSHVTHPAGMEHTFETEIGFDYWSENEAAASYRTAAGYYGWNDPIFDLNVKVTAHIKTFRLFYKIDNLLNRKLSYVPGYFSPGLTFRWGLNWFLL